jgi:hypothetical protein
MKKILTAFLLVCVMIGSAQGAPTQSVWKGDLRHVVERDGVSYSIFADRTRMVKDCIPDTEPVLETYVHLVIESQNLVEIQQWNIRQDGSGYRVQDMYDYTLDTFGMVDQ